MFGTKIAKFAAVSIATVGFAMGSSAALAADMAA